MEKETVIKEGSRKNVERKIVTAALATSLFLGGCQAAVDEAYSDSDSKEADPIEEVGDSKAFYFAEGYDSEGKLLKDEVIQGPAIVKKNPDTNDIAVIYDGAEYLVDYGMTWLYEGDSQKALESQIQFFDRDVEGEELDINIERIGLEEPELEWTEDFHAKAGTEVEGLALIETDQGWIKVASGEAYTMKTSGNVNKYEGNDTGLSKEYIRVVEKSRE